MSAVVVPDLSTLCLRVISSHAYDVHRLPSSLTFLPQGQAHALVNRLPQGRWGHPGVLAQFVDSSVSSLHLAESSAFPIDLLLSHGFLGNDVFPQLDNLSCRGAPAASLTDHGLAHLAHSLWAQQRLTCLDLSCCPGITTKGVALLVHLSVLTRLDLSGRCGLTISYLPNECPLLSQSLSVSNALVAGAWCCTRGHGRWPRKRQETATCHGPA